MKLVSVFILILCSLGVRSEEVGGNPRSLDELLEYFQITQDYIFVNNPIGKTAIDDCLSNNHQCSKYVSSNKKYYELSQDAMNNGFSLILEEKAEKKWELKINQKGEFVEFYYEGLRFESPCRQAGGQSLLLTTKRVKEGQELCEDLFAFIKSFESYSTNSTKLYHGPRDNFRLGHPEDSGYKVRSTVNEY